MNTKPNLEKATARPWKDCNAGKSMRENYAQSRAIAASINERVQLIAGCFMDVSGGEEQAGANSELIVQAVNEYDALNAIAEAAKMTALQLAMFASMSRLDRQIIATSPKIIKEKYLKPLDDALAALETIRKERAS